MNELFRNDGHLTDYAFKALINDQPLDELSRLEIAEHLSFCDECVSRYSALLTGEALIEPEETVVPTVMERIRTRARLIFFNKYVAVVMAASIAMVLWVTGVFDAFTSDEMNQTINYLSERSDGFGERATGFAQGISDGVGDIIDKIQNYKSDRNSENNNQKGN